MIRKCLYIALCVGGALLFEQSEAQAKTVNMGSLSRDTVSFACRRAGGQAFGTENSADQYGCSASFAIVICSETNGCVATVNDLTPVVGNSIDSILSIGSINQGLAVQPINARVGR
ncbi:MAG TPA: hypothetical protein VGM43_26585 [Bryobacteraceae bacterium]